MLGAPTPADLARCDLLLHGSLRDFCADRGIDTATLARRSSSGAPSAPTTGSTS